MILNTRNPSKLGANTMYIQKWEYNGGKRFNSVIKSYEGQDLVIFEQHFVDGIEDSSGRTFTCCIF